jgi:hypothetical protein
LTVVRVTFETLAEKGRGPVGDGLAGDGVSVTAGDNAVAAAEGGDAVPDPASPQADESVTHSAIARIPKVTRRILEGLHGRSRASDSFMRDDEAATSGRQRADHGGCGPKAQAAPRYA